MSNHQENNMILDQDMYNEHNKDLDLEEKEKNFYPQNESRSEEGSKKVKSSKTLFQSNKKISNTLNIHYKEKKSHTQINRIKKGSHIKKNNKDIFSINFSESSEKSKNYNGRKRNNNDNNNKDEKTEINYNNYSHENMINNNIMDIEEKKGGDIFEKENAELIKRINHNNNKFSEEIPSGQSSINDSNSNGTPIIFIGCC